jgi:hypothetical protein
MVRNVSQSLPDLQFYVGSTIQNFCEQHNKFFVLLLQEELYGVLWSSSQNDLKTRNNFTQVSKVNIPAIKRAIRKIRYGHNDKDVPFSKGPNFESDVIYKSINNSVLNRLLITPITLVLIASYESYRKGNGTSLSLLNSNRYVSLHSAFSFLENRWPFSSTGIEADIFPLVHPEIVLRIFRKIVRDLSFLHLLRQLLHHGWIRFEHPISKFNLDQANPIICLLWNFYACEFDEFLKSEIDFLLHRKEQYSGTLVQEYSCHQKLKEMQISSLSLRQKNDLISNSQMYDLSTHIFCRYSPVYNADFRVYDYLRFGNSWLLTIQGSKKLIFFLEQRILRFWEYRLGCYHHHTRIRFKSWHNNGHFLGYAFNSYTTTLPILMKQFKVFNPVVLKNKALCFNIPLDLVIRVFSYFSFCTSTGYPISKSAWVTYMDSEIVRRFKRIRNKLIGYYIGCANRKSLSYIQHILRYSCAKTLASKHKTTLRRIWKQYGFSLSIKSSQSTSLSQVVFGQINVNSLSTRGWNFYLTEFDIMTFFIQDAYRKRQSLLFRCE